MLATKTTARDLDWHQHGTLRSAVDIPAAYGTGADRSLAAACDALTALHPCKVLGRSSNGTRVILVCHALLCLQDAP